MPVIFYTFFLWLFRVGMYAASLFDPKAKKWVRGRKNIFERLGNAITPGEKIIWFHCASLGEFEQGRPVMERIRQAYPGYRILLTFFSPSGYEVQKNYSGADWVFYLPIDGPRNAKRFLEIVHPSLIIFVKYEFWYFYLKKIRYRKIPLLLISALFRKDMPFFKWYGDLQRKMLALFDHIFVQESSSKELIDGIGLSAICSIGGDTRFDRVTDIAKKSEPLPVIEEFIGIGKAIIAGSTWIEDEKALRFAFTALANPEFKLIIAPHEISEKHLNELKELFPTSIRYSHLLTVANDEARPGTILIVDNIGMLSRLYKYGYITYVGGGLIQQGVHNVLEAAVYDKIVLMGHYYQKYSEAIGLVASGGGIPFKANDELAELLSRLIREREEYIRRSKAAGDYVRSRQGATQRIIAYIQENRLLTN